MNKISSLIKKETGFEGESNQLLFLLRYLLLSLVPYSLAVAVVAQINGQPLYRATSLIFAGLFVACLVLSYRLRPPRIRSFVMILLCVYAWIFTAGFGWRISFQYLVFVAFFTFWYDISISIPRKLLFSVLACLFFCLSCAHTPFGQVSLTPGTPLYQFMTCLNIIYCIACLTLVAAFFCTQYAEAERQLYVYNKQLKKISETDPLTGLPNRRFILDEMSEIEKNYENEGKLVTVCIGDIDFFKKVNDNFGHEAGDYVLTTLGDMLQTYMKNYGTVARWGGEEFLFVFENSNGDDAFLAIEALRVQVERTPFIFNGDPIPITMTFGIEEFSPRAGTDPTIAAADKKLYLGKSGGRNRTVF